MTDLEGSVDRIAAETVFSGVVRVDRGGEVELVKAYGLAHRGWEIPNEVDTRFGIASGTKGFTALTVMSLIEEGRLDLGTTARSLLGNDLPLIDEAVTVEHLLAHRSGIGDYYDEEIVRDPLDYVSPVPVHELGSTAEYLRVLGGFETKFPPDERFSYSNGGYVVLALIAERAIRDAVPRAGGATRVRTRRHGGYGVPALGRTPGPHGPRLPRRGRSPGPTSSTCRCEGAGTAGSPPPRRTSAPCGPPCSPAASCRWTSSPRWCNPGARCRRRRNRPGSAWGSGSTPPATWWSCTDRTQACRSRPSTTRASAFTYTVLSNTTDGAWPIVLHLDELFHVVSLGSVTAVEREVPRVAARVTTGTSRCPRAPSRSRAWSTPSCVMSIAAPSWCQDSPGGAHRSGHPSGFPQIERHACRCSAHER